MLMVNSAAGQPFQLMEASINEIHRGLESGKLTCHSLVQQYIDRIKAYDQQGPALNALLYVNPKALEQAHAMDKQFKRGSGLKPLQCIPVVLKDNFDTPICRPPARRWHSRGCTRRRMRSRWRGCVKAEP